MYDINSHNTTKYDREALILKKHNYPVFVTDIRGISLIFAAIACVIALILGTSLVSAAYGNYKRTILNNEERQSELYVLSCAELIRDELEGKNVTVTTVTVLIDGEIFAPERQEGSAVCSGSGWVEKLLNGAYSGGGNVTMTAMADSTEPGFTWTCSFDGLKKNEAGVIDLTQPLIIYITSDSDGIETAKTLEIRLTTVMNTRSEDGTAVKDGAQCEAEYLYNTYTYTLGKGEID